MLNCSKALHGALYTNTIITDLVALSSKGYPAIFNDNPVPKDEQGVYPSINHYRNGEQSVNQVWTDITFIVNSWALTKSASETIQETIAYQLNDSWYDGFRFQARILPTIPINEDGGVYNAPCEIRVQTNKTIV